MRTTGEYLSLQLVQRAERVALADAGTLTTARFETVYRDMQGSGMLDLVFECEADVFVAHAVAVDVAMLVTREGPSLVWPATLAIEPDRAAAIEEFVTPWLLSLARGRGMAGEYVRQYRPSGIFDAARARNFRGAVPSAVSLPLMAPFVYARRFAAGRDVRVACADAVFAAAVVGTVARSVEIATTGDALAERWYDVPARPSADAAPEVAIVDRSSQPEAAGVSFVVALEPGLDDTATVIPVPVPQDHLFTFDPADAPEAGRFGVRARDRVERAVRASFVPPAEGGSDGRVAVIVRDDASFAADADTDACAELERRLRAEGLEAHTMTASDPRLAQAGVVHIFGGIDDAHVAAAAQAARAAGVPYVLTVEPLAPYAKYYEDGLVAALRIGGDDADQRYYLDLLYARRLRFDEFPADLDAGAYDARDRAFESVCSGAAGVFVAPCDAPEAFRARFPRIPADRVVGGPLMLAPEAPEEPVAALVPARPFLLVHAPFCRRSALGHVLSALGEAPFDVVVAGPVSEVDIAFSLRRVGGSGVVFLPDPTPGQIAALYRRARAVLLPALRPAGAGRVIRAALCGALPLVPQGSPLARLVPPECTFDENSAGQTRDSCAAAMFAEPQRIVEPLAAGLEPLADQRAAFAAILGAYARSSSPIAR
jgi:hypothetical protein